VLGEGSTGPLVVSVVLLAALAVAVTKRLSAGRVLQAEG
jgi:hypothetical protein